MSLPAFKFAEFELDPGRYELRRGGKPVKLERLPMELLILLVEKNAHLVTREEIVDRLWGSGVFLDTEHGTNTAIRKIRHVLRDDSEQPRFIQTVTGKGYRFIAATNATSRQRGNGNHKPATPLATQLDDPEDPPQQILAGTSPIPAMESTRSGRRIVLLLVALLATAAIVVGLTASGARSWWSAPTFKLAIHSLAVLPLENLSGDPAQEYFADGMTEELITVLAKNSGLRVISRTSAMHYKKADRPLPDIARELGVDGILEGSVGRSGGRVHVNVQLIHGPSDTHLWAESYDRDLSDVGALQNELARTITGQIGHRVASSYAPERRISPEAHDQYLLGKYYWYANDSEKSRQFFQKAVDLQPDYAAAWSGVADSYVASAIQGTARADSVMPQAEEAARKAASLDDSLAEAHKSLAAIYLFYRWNWKLADVESARAVELNPGLAEAHHLRGDLLQVLNRRDQALAEQKKAMELDPFSRRWTMALALLQARRFDAALKEARLRSEAHPDDAELHSFIASAYWHKGMEKESAQEWETWLRLSGEPDHALALRNAFERGGMKAVFEWELNDAKKKALTKYVPPSDLAILAAGLKRKEETLRYLEKAYEERDPCLVYLQSNGNFDFLQSDPHYQAIVRRMGLPLAQ